MSKTIMGTGSCLCGAVRFTAKNTTLHVCACHCKMCRKWGGGPFMEVDCGEHIVFEGEQYISVFNSSAWAERGFCNQCGSHLFYRLKETQQHMVLVGLFDDDTQFVFDKQVFVDERPDYYRFDNKTQELTAAQAIAMYEVPQ